MRPFPFEGKNKNRNVKRGKYKRNAIVKGMPNIYKEKRAQQNY